MAVPHPIPYQGSKRKLAPQIIAFIPDGCERLIEPFAGSAAVSLAAAYSGKVQRFVLGDLNAPLIALWQAIIDSPEVIAEQYQALWLQQKGQERSFYDHVRDEFNRSHRPDYFLYLLARCVKAAVRYNAQGEFNQSPDNRRKGARPQTMKRHICQAAQLLRGKTDLVAGDFQGLLNIATSKDIVYLDPPYQGVCGKRDPRYIGGLTKENFINSLSHLNNRDIPYIVSYDGRSGAKSYGEPLPAELFLKHIELDAGQSSQATLLGRKAKTIESLYLSPALAQKLDSTQSPFYRQLTLFPVQ